jgi:hypothetical protein
MSAVCGINGQDLLKNSTKRNTKEKIYELLRMK